jgi:adenylate cyclase
MIARFQPYIIALAITGLGIAAFFSKESSVTNFIEVMSLKTIDLRFDSRGAVSPGEYVSIAAIDEKSLSAEGKWPWPRVKMASLVTKLSEAGAKVIAFDVGFLDDDDKRVISVLSSIKDNLRTDAGGRSYLDSLIQNADHDRRFADAVRNSKAAVVLGYYFTLNDQMDAAGETPAKDPESTREELISSSQFNRFTYKSDKAEKDSGFLIAKNPQPNIRVISESSQKSGFFNMKPDQDGIVRSMPAVILYHDLLYAPLSLMAVAAFLDAPLSIDVGETRDTVITIGSNAIPVDRDGSIMINYRGGPQTFPHVSITDILNGRADNSLIRNRVVIVGATATALSDIRSTPFSTVSPGCEIHANIIDSILSGDQLYHPPLYSMWSVLAIFLAGAVLGLVLPFVGAVPGLLVYSGLAAFYWFLCQFLFSRTGLVLNMVYPLTVLTLVYIAVTTDRYLSESKKKKFISDAFSTYLAPSVVKQLIKSPDKLGLGGEDREITAFFSDVQGFTSISEKLSAKELVELLNEFLTEMTDIILTYEGTVDKFEGDAIIAFFGAPLALENHALSTCRACIDMHERLKVLNDKWKRENRPQLHMRIGLCSGVAVVGNMGSVNRMDYTMMGDVVNTAARLEGINKVYGTYSLIGESTKQLAGPDIMTREIDSIFLVGKFEPVNVYQIIGRAGHVDETLARTVALYEKGLACYRSKDFSTALTLFGEALSLSPDDGPAKTLASRCREYMQTPPPQDWNGVYKATSK